jgi:alpha-tubulin suppressor-like RCC1 family protein
LEIALAISLFHVIRTCVATAMVALSICAPDAQAQIVATQIALGSGHMCALTAAGGVKCWLPPGPPGGSNLRGVLGHGLTTGSQTPVDVVGLGSGVTAISVGATHSCALLATGAVKCWGDNQFSALGDPSLGTVSSNYSGQTFSNVPVQVSGLTSGVTAIAAGESYSCALLTSGAVQCWGNSNFPYYTTLTGPASNVPVNALGFSSGVLSIAAGEKHFCAIMTGGSVRCQGDNVPAGDASATVIGAYTGRDLPTFGTGNLKVSTNAYHVCVLTSSNGVKCWGAGVTGQLGRGTTASSNVAADVTGITSNATAIGTGTTAVGGSTGYSCAVVGGAAKCWGQNLYKELGDATTTQRNAPVQVTGLTAGVVAIDGHWSRTCALLSNGGITCWGADGSGTATPPTAVAGFGGTVPGAPQNVVGTSGNGSVSVAFTPPSSDGGAPVFSYMVSCVNGASTVTATGTSSPINVVGLTNGLAYTCTVRAQNSIGFGPPSSVIGPLTPSLLVQTITFTQPPSPIAYNVGATFPVSGSTLSTSTVIFTSGSPTVCTVLAGIVTVLAPGICIINANAAGDATYAPASQITRTVVVRAVCTLDIDQDGFVLPLTDGLLVLRRMLGLSGSALKNGAFNPAGFRLDATDMANIIDPMTAGQTLDIDGNGSVSAATDGVLLLRALFGFGGAAVTDAALGASPRSRGDWAGIRTYLVSECGLVNLAP